MPVRIALFTDPACPFAFSAEPVRWRLRWHYGAALEWRIVLICLTRGDEVEAGRLAGGAPTLQRLHGMPIDPRPRVRPASSEPACLAVAGARLHAPGREEALLRRLAVRCQAGGLLDDPALIDAAARDVGLDPADVAAWQRDPAVAAALDADVAEARRPGPAARALAHKLGGPAEARRYSAPSYELEADGRRFSLPGFNGIEAYEAAIASLAPDLPRRPRPADVAELLAWAGEPLATAEIALVMAADAQSVRAELADVARAIPAGADAYWTLRDGCDVAPAARS